MVRLLSVLILCHWPAILCAAVSIRVVDDSGEPIEEFSAVAQTTIQGAVSSLHSRGRDGKFRIHPNENCDRNFRVAVFAPGYAAAVRKLVLDDMRENLVGPAEVVLARGQDVRLHLRLPRGMKLPVDLVPHVYLHDFADTARNRFRPGNVAKADGLYVERKNDGDFVFQLPADNLEFSISLHRPGWLRFFEAGPFTSEDIVDGCLTVAVPRPASVEARFDTDEYATADLPFDQVQIRFHWYFPGTAGTMMQLDNYNRPVDFATFSAHDLAPGRYRILMETVPGGGDQHRTADQIDPSRFYDIRRFEVSAGEKATLALRYQPFDPEIYRGERVAEIKIFTQNGSPVVGQPAEVTYFDGHYGKISVPCGPISDEGILLLEGVTDRQPETTDKPPYSIRVAGQWLGRFSLAPIDEVQTFEFRVTPRVGDPAPDIEFLNVSTGETLTLSSYRGQIVFIEFWATWCGPCQPPMAKLDELIGSDDQQVLDKVVVLPISIDETRDLVIPHVETLGWTHLDHYWSGGSDASESYSSPAANALGIRGLPTGLLIDCKGTIVWRGHPASFDLPAEVKKLLADDIQHVVPPSALEANRRQ